MNDKNLNKSKIVLIGLVGSLGSGRTAISNFLHYAHGFLPLNFTDFVRKIADLFEKTDVRSLQALRQTIRCSLGEDAWIKVIEKRMEEELISRVVKAYSIPGVSEAKPVLRVVIGDVGYRNEFNFIKQLGGLTIGLKSSEETLYKHMKERKTDLSFEEFKKWLEHSSEIEIPLLIEECDFILDRDKLPLHIVEEEVIKKVKSSFSQ